MKGQKSIWSFIKGYRFNSLLLKNLAYVFILVTLPLLLVLSINYNKFNDVVNSRVMDMNEELLQKNAAVTDNIMVGLLDTVNKLSQLNAVTEIVQMDAVDQTYEDKVALAVAEVKTHTMSNNMILSFSIYSDVNEMLIDSMGARKIHQIVNKDKWYQLHKQMPMVVPYILVNHANSIYVCQPIWSGRGQRVGLFVLEIELQKIRDVLESQEAARQGIFFVMDISGQVIYCSEKNGFAKDTEALQYRKQDIAKVKPGESQLVTNHGKYIISAAESSHKSWKYAFVTELPNYEEELSVVRGFLLSSVTIGLFSSIIVAFIITIFTYRPVRKIINVIHNPQLHWNEKEATKASNKWLYIAGNILADGDADRDISEEFGERIKSLRQAQFRALQFQIDPHFLYNTLETIKWNAVEEMGLGNKTSKMLTKVARLYRQGLENDDVVVTLKEEWDFLKLYIEIVRIRFGDSIQFHWNIDESLYQSSVIKMCLQPIVENAIQHGLRPNNYKGNITISAYQQKDCLCISVENDGQDMSQTEIKKLNQKLKTGAGFEENKVGLRNVNERIKLIYGKKYGVTVSCANGSGNQPGEANKSVRVVLTFPNRKFIRSEETK